MLVTAGQEPPVVHLTYREGMSSVFLSQVVRPMSLMRSRGRPVVSAVFVPVGEYYRRQPRKRWRERLAGIAAEFGLPVRQMPSPPSRLRGLWAEAPLLRRWLKRYFGRDERILIHCRGPEAANLALEATHNLGDRFRVVFDCRGLNGIEFLYFQGFHRSEDAPEALRVEAEAIEQREKQAARQSHGVLCVSRAMKQAIGERWQLENEGVAVVPCCADIEAGRRARRDRDRTRHDLGLEGRLVVAFCGSMAPWQMPEESLAVFLDVSSRRSDAHFLGITTQPDRLEAAADRVGVDPDQRTILSVPHGEVPRYLAAADMGLLIRDASLVNRVASPVKFAEYLACGVPVLISEGVGDFPEAVRAHRLGWVMGREDVAWDGPAPDAAMVNAAMDYAARHLSWENHVSTLADVYQRVAT